MFEPEGKRHGIFWKQPQLRETFETDAETGMIAWIELLNHRQYEANTGRIVRVDCQVD